MSWKKVEFKGSDSVDRLQRIQSLCSSSDPKLDGILIIGGVDSFHSQASQAALKYLFLGNSGQELLGEQVIQQEHERLEDVVLLICPQRVFIFYSSESDAAVKILPVISNWRHVTEYVVHDGMEPDELEERKISAFKSMMTGVKCVGVPFGTDQNGINLQDTMLPEKWPLVQFYGLEGGESSGKGFFTMNHRVVNISQEMMQVMARLDSFSAKRVVQESQPFLAHHFDEFLMKLDHESPDVRNAKSESDLGEDLLSFYEFGTMQYSARGLKTTPSRGSRVLYGVRTRSLTEKSSSKAFLENSGVMEDIPATHMVVQAEDPFTGVRFARTYFLSSGKVCSRVVDEDALVSSPAQSNSDAGKTAVDTKTMIEMYALLLRGFKTGAADLVRECMDGKLASLDRCLESARAEAIHAIVQTDKVESQLLGSNKFPTKFIDDQLSLKAEIMDARGQRVDSLTEGMYLYFLRFCYLYIPMQSGSRFQDEVFRALEAWKVTAAALNISIYRTSDLSEQFEGDTPRDRDAFVGQDARTVDNFFPRDFIPKDPNAVTTLSKPNTEDLSRLIVPVTVMLGIPGSGAQALGQSVCQISSASFEWVTVNVDLRDLELSKQQKMEASGYFEISDKLTRELDQIKSTAKTLRLPPRIMMSIVGYVDPITVVCAIRRAAGNSSLSSKIGAVINCVSATNVYLPDPLATQAPFPKLFDQMTAGFVTHTVLTNSSDVSSAILQRLRFHMDQVNPFADVIVLSHDVFEGPLTPLLAVDRFESAYYKQYRNSHFQDWDSPASNSAAPMYTRYVAELEPTHAPVSYRFEIAPGMDRSKFSYLIAKTLTPFAAMTKAMDRVYPMENKSTKGIRIAQTIAAGKVRQDVQTFAATPYAEGVFSNGQSRSCWCVEGQVVFKDEPGCVYEYRSSGTFARLWVDADHLSIKAGNLPSLELKITGQGLNAEKLRELLLNCYAHAEASPNQIRSKASISLDEKREIQRQHAMDPLPEGYLFDGTNYVDFFGGRYEFHPCIAQFIDEYITAANDDRKATNLKASEERESQQSFVKQLV
ncbi:hypothetical protein JG688_00009598 [Phytophthora aleatoria]|uniref:Uncharacterized protein n=1 Tax=Phytophthora aleatoria TaxID=2496075 RepID=A0A8J5MFE4_9STRA|nr:hypothetical protein JG688_00009598 [Phytophthora aleatoria]